MLNINCNTFKVSKIVLNWCLYVNYHLMKHNYNEYKYVLSRDLVWSL
jgi:hypothetical protein